MSGSVLQMRLTASLFFPLIFSACACTEEPVQPEVSLVPHLVTNFALEVDFMPAGVGGVLYGDEIEFAEMLIREDLDVIGPDGARISEPCRVEWDSRGRPKYFLSFGEGPGWYTVRMRKREGVHYYSCHENEPGLCESDVLPGIMEPGIMALGLSPAEDGSGDIAVRIKYSERVMHDRKSEDSFEMLYSDGETVSCRSYVYIPSDDPAEIPPWELPEPDYETMSGRGLFLFQCDGHRAADITAIRVTHPPWSEDLSVRATFPPEGEAWEMDLVWSRPDAALWIPDRRSFSEHIYATQVNELRFAPTAKGESAPPGGCGAQTARGEQAKAAGALVLMLALLWRRLGGEPSPT